MDTSFVSILLIIFAIPFAVVLASFVVTFREKRFLWYLEPMGESASLAPSPTLGISNPYAPTESATSSLPITPDAQQHGSELTELGYQYVGAFRHAKRGIYQIRYDVMIAPDRNVLAMIEAGKLMSMPVCNITLLSMAARHADGKTIGVASITSESCFEVDYGDLNETMVFNRFGAGRAEALHRQRLSVVDPIEFSDDPLNDLYQFRLKEQLVGIDNGFLRLVEEGVTLPTIRGGIKSIIDTYGFQIGRRLYPHHWRLKRKLKRQHAVA